MNTKQIWRMTTQLTYLSVLFYVELDPFCTHLSMCHTLKPYLKCKYGLFQLVHEVLFHEIYSN